MSGGRHPRRGASWSPIVRENGIAGVADSTVGYGTIGSGTDGFYGYAKQFSTNVGNTVQFAVDGVNAADIAIHRIGHYGGLRWRLVATVANTGTNQPDSTALTDGAGARTCAGWSVTASWAIPANAVSGLYVGVVRNSGGTAQSWIPFIVREDSRTADIVIRVSDTTWGAAYNYFGTKAAPLGGKSLYGEGIAGSAFDINLRGVQMSYDRPIVSRGATTSANFVNHWDVLESALIDWVEKNGFNVKYISCYDLDQGLTAVGSAKILACAGHDEYWSDGMVNNTEAFIAAGGQHVSMSANSQFWRIRWADGGRTFFCYKDTMPGPTVLRTGGAGTALDPVSWTGTWRDTRWGSRRPENLLLGSTFRMNGIRDETMVINGAANQTKPFWRSTTVASGTNLTVAEVIGFEADSLDIPTPGVNLGATTININGSYADDNGQNYTGNGDLNWGIACHYPKTDAGSGLSVHFATNQWMWGLSNYHRRGSAVNNREMRQATYNLLTDMGALAATKESDLTTVTPVALSTYGATRPTALPAVSVAVSPSSTAEDGTTNLVFTFTRTVTTGTLSVNYSIGGTATNGTDYATIASPVSFADGASTATVTVNPTTDATNESDETVILTVTTGSGYTVGSPASATGTINNDDGSGGATFLALSDQFSGGGTSVSSGTATLATVSSGDLVIAIVQAEEIALRTASVTCGGNAMTLVRTNALATGSPAFGFGMRLYAIIAPSSGTSVAVTANFSPNTIFATVTAARYSGVSSATALASSCNASACNALAASASNIRVQSITTGSSALLVVAGTNYDFFATHTGASGFTKRLDGSGTPLTSIQFLHDNTNAAAGTYGGAVNLATTGTADQYLAVLAAFPLS